MKMLRMALGAILLALAACGGGGKAYIPVDSPLKPWQPPEEVADEPAAQEPAPAPAPAQPAPAAAAKPAS